MKKVHCFFLLAVAVPHFLCAQNVGIGTSSPLFRLHVEQGNVLFKGPVGLPAIPGPLPVSGAGTKLTWYPDKAAFRAGSVSGNQWDSDNTGAYSVALGFNTIATGNGAVAIGLFNRADGSSSTAFGNYCTGSGASSTTFGNFCTASGSPSTAFGDRCIASGSSSTAFGSFCTATGTTSTAFGSYCSASDLSSTAFGLGCNASGDYSTAFELSSTASGKQSVAMGSSVSTSGYAGAFALGDASTTIVMPSFVANGFRARFAGGYRLFTNSGASIGAFLNANANSWAALSDVRMKENFLPVDGEVFLKKIAAMPQVTWNYIGQDAKTLRHYGPMAQDFYKAFGRDGIGEIGCDTLINQQDFLGVNFIAIQALEKRSSELEKRNTETEKRSSELEKENAALKSKQLMLEAANKDLTKN